jgi:hypothetical protein
MNGICVKLLQYLERETNILGASNSSARFIFASLSGLASAA